MVTNVMDKYSILDALRTQLKKLSKDRKREKSPHADDARLLDDEIVRVKDLIAELEEDI
jgi:hypothetical protein